MLVMVVFFIAFRWIHLSTPLIRLFLLVLILLLMPTLNFLPVWLDRKSGSAVMPRTISTLFPYTTLFRSLHCIQMDTSVNAANQVVSVGADIAFDADPKFFACLVRFESSSVPTTLPTAYDVYPLDGRHDGGYYTVKDCVTIDVLPRTPGNNVYVGFMVWSNFTATKCRGLVSLNQVIIEVICLRPLKGGDLCLVLLLAVLLLLLLVAPCLNCLEAVKKPPPVAFKVMCLLPITIL